MTFSRKVRGAAALACGLLAAALLMSCGSDSAQTSLPRAVAPAPPEDETASAPYPGEHLQLPAQDVRAIAYAPDGSQVALSSGSAIWLYTSALEPVRALAGHSAPVRDLAWSPDGARLASASLDNSARIWEAAGGELLATLEGHRDWVLGVAWSADGERLATASTDGSVRLWDAASGDLVTTLGTTRVEQVVLQLADAEVFEALQDLEYARKIVDRIEGEPRADLVGRIEAAGYRIRIALGDPALVDRLLALHDGGYTVRIATQDQTLRDELATLEQAELIELLSLLDDPAVDTALAELAAAEATVAEISEREDAAMLRTVRQLRGQELVIVIETTGGETTTLSPEDDFIATIRNLGDEDFSLSLEVDQQAELVAKLQDPEFVAALQQLDEATEAIAAFNTRDDALAIRLVRQLRAGDYQVMVKAPGAGLTSELAALDAAEVVRLIELLQDETLLTTLRQVAAAGYRIDALSNHDTRALLRGLGGLDATVTLEVRDKALAAEVAAFDQADVLALIGLLEDEVFLYMLDARRSAQRQLDDLQARADYAFLALMYEVGEPSGVDVTFSWPQGGSRINVNRKVNRDAFELALLPQDDAVRQELSALDDATIAARLVEQDPAMLLTSIEEGRYSLVPALDPDALQLIAERLDGETLRVLVRRENNAHTGGVSGVAWSRDGTLIASAGADATLRLWSPETGALLAVLDGHSDSVTALVWGTGAGRFASASWDTSAIVWQVDDAGTSADPAVTVDAGAKRIQALAWSPDESALLSGSRTGTLALWDAASGAALARLELEAEVLAVAWSPDGAWLLSSGRDGVVRLWDAGVLLAGE